MHIFVGFMQRRDYEPCHFWDGPHCDISWLLLFTNCCHGEIRFSCCRVPGSALGHVYVFCVFQLLVSGNFHFIYAKFNIYLPYRRTCNSHSSRAFDDVICLASSNASLVNHHRVHIVLSQHNNWFSFLWYLFFFK